MFGTLGIFGNINNDNNNNIRQLININFCIDIYKVREILKGIYLLVYQKYNINLLMNDNNIDINFYEYL